MGWMTPLPGARWRAKAPQRYQPDPEIVHHVGTSKIFRMFWSSLMACCAVFLGMVEAGLVWIPTKAVSVRMSPEQSLGTDCLMKAEYWRNSAPTTWERVAVLIRAVLLVAWVAVNMELTIKRAQSHMVHSSYQWHARVDQMLLFSVEELMWTVFNAFASRHIFFPGDALESDNGQMAYIALFGNMLLFWCCRFGPHAWSRL